MQRYHSAAKCEDCPLQEFKSYVPTKLPTEEYNGIAIVGEGPGYNESIKGEPFTGNSGKLLNKVLEHHGIKRNESLLTNAVSCRPPGNMTPPKAAINCCRPRLDEELATTGTTKVLALGNTAAQTLLETPEKITSLRVGRPRKAARLEGATVVPTIHPAACLRQGDMFPSLVTDVGKLVFTSDDWQPPDFKVFDDEESAVEVLKLLADMSRTGELVHPFLPDDLPPAMVVDIECDIEKDKAGAFEHPSRYGMLCVGLQYAKGKAIVIGEEAMKSEAVCAQLKTTLDQFWLVMQNGKFDMQGLFRLIGKVRLAFDTMLASYCQDERPGNHALEGRGIEILGTPDWKGELDQYLTSKASTYADIPRPILYKYNAYDVAVTWDLFEHDWKQLTAQDGLMELHNHLVNASNELMYLEMNGLKVDLAYNTELSNRYLGYLEDLEFELDRAASSGNVDEEGNWVRRINPRSPKQVKEYLHDKGIRVESTNQDTLERVLTKLDKKTFEYAFVDTLLKHRRKAKLHGTYIKGIRNRVYRGRVFTTYRLDGTTSGRLASRNPNLQNIVRDNEIKRQFTVARDGNVFVQADYKQVEGRVITTLAQDEYLRAIFQDADRDLFNELGKDLYHKETFTKDERVRIKAYFYGIGYGRDAYSIHMEYDIPLKEAEAGLQAFYLLIPDVVKWQKSVRESVLAGNELCTTYGRRRRYTLITNENKKDVLNEALSFLPQSTASDICLSALIRLRPMLKGLGYIRLTIHDALIVECPEENLEQVQALMRKVMIEEAAKWTDYVPFDVDFAVGKTWGDFE